MKKIYVISGFILSLLTYAILMYIFQNEDKSFRVVAALFAATTLVLSIPSSFISWKIIKYGDSIDELLFKVIYYMTIPLISFGVWILLVLFIFATTANGNVSNDFQSSLSHAIMALFLYIASIIAVALPYVQSLLVLVLRRLMKSEY